MNILKDIELVVIAAVKDQPRHGYDLHKSISDPEGIGGIWRIKMSRLYAILNGLEQKGFIKSREEQSENRPPKKIFSMTPAAEKLLHAWLLEPVAHGREFRQIFLAKLFYVLKEGKKKANVLINCQISECKKWLVSSDQSQPDMDQDFFIVAVHQFRKMQIMSYIEWLDWLSTKEL